MGKIDKIWSKLPPNNVIQNDSFVLSKISLLPFQEDILFLYKAMEALVASNHAVNPVIPASSQLLPPTDQTCSSPVAVAACTVTAAAPSDGTALVTSNGGGAIANGNGNGHHNSSADQRRHSLSDCRSNGSISNVGVDPGGGGGGGEPGSAGKAADL